MDKLLRLDLLYDGTNYFGWQVQRKNRENNKITVQSVLEEALKKLFQVNVLDLKYASRTDRGVHACHQCVTVKVSDKIPLENIKKALNSLLPQDVRIKQAQWVDRNFHPRFQAYAKQYRYLIYNGVEFIPFYRYYSWHIPANIDLTKIKKIIPLLEGQRDFSPFAHQAKQYNSCIRNIFHIKIKKIREFIIIDITGDGFLRHMVRNIVNFLMEVGLETLSLEKAEAILTGRSRYCKHPAPAQGLYLKRIFYYD